MQHGVHSQSRASFLLKWGIFQTFLLLFVCHGSAMAEPKPESSYWYSHDYPNPRTEPERCGRNAYHQSWLCDPDDFISEKDAATLDELISSIYSDTRCNCYPCITNSHGYLIMVALMEAMYREPVNGTQTRQQLMSDTNTFASELMQQWGQKSDCKEYVLILFSRSDKVLYTKRQENAQIFLNNTLVTKVSTYVSKYFSYKEGVAKGLTEMIGYYRDIFFDRFKDPGPMRTLIRHQVQYSERQEAPASKANSKHQRINSLFGTFVLLSLSTYLLTYSEISFI